VSPAEHRAAEGAKHSKDRPHYEQKDPDSPQYRAMDRPCLRTAREAVASGWLSHAGSTIWRQGGAQGGVSEIVSPTKISDHRRGASGVTTSCPQPQKHVSTAVVYRTHT
jgi:hypothetical protein